MIRVTGAPSVFDRLASNNANDGQGLFATMVCYWNWTREAADSRRLGDLSCFLIVLIIIAIFSGFQSRDMELAKKGVDEILCLMCFGFSLYVMVKAKANPNQHFTYGYTRYETIAAFANCLFLMIQSLVLLVDIFHRHEDDDHDDNHQSSPQQQSTVEQGDQAGSVEISHSHGSIASTLFSYGKLLMYVIGIVSFWAYSRFSPIEKLEDIGAGSNRFAYAGVGQSEYQHFTSMIEPFYRNVSQGKSASAKEIEAHPNTPLLHFTSHFEHMHSVYLLFLVKMIIGFTPILANSNLRVKILGDSLVSAAVVPVLAIALTIALTKPLFVAMFKLLLQGLPIEDEAGVAAVLQELRAMKEVIEVVNAKFWGLTASYLVCNLTIRIKRNSDAATVYKNAVGVLSKKFSEVSVQIEEVKKDH